jgi:hypothetical protein
MDPGISFLHHLHHFFKDKKSKRSHKTVGINQGFTYYFCLEIEGSGSAAGSVPLTNESGFGSIRPKNIRIRRIRIRNTARIIFTMEDDQNLLFSRTTRYLLSSVAYLIIFGNWYKLILQHVINFHF